MVTKGFDLRRRLYAAVRCDLLEHPELSLDALHVLGVLRALLGGEAALRLDLLFLDPKPHPEWRDADCRKWDQHPDPACNIIHGMTPSLALRYIVAASHYSTSGSGRGLPGAIGGVNS